MIDLSHMTIENIIFHHVPNSTRGLTPTFGTQTVDLSAEAITELIRRITDVMGRGSNCLEMRFQDITDVSSVSQVIGIINNFDEESNNTFISRTTSLAQKLYQAQINNRIPDGVLVCLAGRTGASQQQYVAVIKAERQSGFHISAIDSIDFLSNLFLTEAQRLYKIGIFVRNNAEANITASSISIYIFDQNALHSGSASLANYFYQTFLGCTPLENIAHRTETFYNTTKDFIVNNAAFSDEKRVDLINSLHSYLKSDQSTIINGQTFAVTYFETPEVIDQYTSRLEQEGFPAVAITKDISLISKKLKVRRMKFSSGVRISFPSSEPIVENHELLIYDNYNETTNYTTLKIRGQIISQ